MFPTRQPAGHFPAPAATVTRQDVIVMSRPASFLFAFPSFCPVYDGMGMGDAMPFWREAEAEAEAEAFPMKDQSNCMYVWP